MVIVNSSVSRGQKNGKEVKSSEKGRKENGVVTRNGGSYRAKNNDGNEVGNETGGAHTRNAVGRY